MLAAETLHEIRTGCHNSEWLANCIAGAAAGRRALESEELMVDELQNIAGGAMEKVELMKLIEVIDLEDDTLTFHISLDDNSGMNFRITSENVVTREGRRRLLQVGSLSLNSDSAKRFMNALQKWCRYGWRTLACRPSSAD